ncbi:GNAT family N-acetyltransferase [bacterium]|nr:GNAT family N-acetyltransferase [bacterium]
MEITIEPIDSTNRQIVKDWIAEWPTPHIISRGRTLWPGDLEGFVAFDSERTLVGLVTYEIIGDQCEVVTLDARAQWAGIGTKLMALMPDVARKAGCSRLWLITTNDNVDAIRFYQKRGFVLKTVHANAIEYSRTLKPEIPKIGWYGIPIRDEVEFEMML